jgi:hypothetical protein
MKSPLILAALIAIGAAATIPLSAQAQPHVSVVISNAPPAPIYERIPGPRRGHVWAPGYWEWRGHRHDWVPGRYVVARPGYVYAPPSWHHRGNRWATTTARSPCMCAALTAMTATAATGTTTATVIATTLMAAGAAPTSTATASRTTVTAIATTTASATAMTATAMVTACATATTAGRTIRIAVNSRC